MNDFFINSKSLVPHKKRVCKTFFLKESLMHNGMGNSETTTWNGDHTAGVEIKVRIEQSDLTK